VGELIVLVVAVVWVFILSWWRQTRSVSGSIDLPNGRSYGYLLGDNLVQYRLNQGFHGIDIALPKEMPHIYLDSLRGGGRRTSMIFDPSQKIALEGDFYRSYQVFVPQKYESLALSILTPDVMQTLQQYAELFDIEIYGSHLRIICEKRVFKHPERQAAVLAAAQKLLGEIDHRLQSWSHESSLDAINQDLLVYPHSGVRIGGRYVSYQIIFLGVYWLLTITAFILLGTFLLISHPDQPWGMVLLAPGAICVFLFVQVTRRGLRQETVYSRRGWRSRK
jgi:hypothetical protein